MVVRDVNAWQIKKQELKIKKLEKALDDQMADTRSLRDMITKQVSLCRLLCAATYVSYYDGLTCNIPPWRVAG